MLGSDFADQYLKAQRPAVLETVSRNRKNFQRDSFHAEYLHCLSALLAAPEPDMPAFMRSSGWQRKSCNTVLSAWTQERHALKLQAKQSVHWLCASFRPAGFVEPQPEFYARFRRHIAKVSKFLEMAGLFSQLSASDKLAIARSETHPYEAFSEAQLELGPRWQKLQEICGQLELLAHKQLRGAEFFPDESNFVLHYGARIAWIMFYEGNSFVHPQDDAARIVEYHATPGAAAPYLHAAIGRPHLVYVLYPWKDKQVVCRGAVLIHYEFAYQNRLTDAEWQKLQDAPECPKPPEWLRPILGAPKAAPEPEAE